MWIAVFFTAVVMTILAAFWYESNKQCRTSIGISRCEAGRDPRCKGYNCTRHCLDMCKCVLMAVEDQKDRKAAADLRFLDKKK